MSVETTLAAKVNRPHRSGRRLVMRALGGVAAGLALLGATACAPLAQLNDWLVPSDGYVRHRGLAYGEGPRQTLDVYQPLNAAADPAPVVVFFYGGAWSSGHRDYYPFVGEALTGLGYVVVVPDYRVYPDVRFPDFVADAAAAVGWVEAHIGRYGGDRDRIVLMGHSAGAHIAAMLAADDRYLRAAGVERGRIRGVIGLAGPYAFDPMRFHTTRAIFADAAVPTMPLSLIDGNEPPMLLLHGSDDRTVYPENSRALADRIWATGGYAKLVEYPEKGHIGLILAMAAPFRNDDGPLLDITRFLDAVTGTSALRASR